MHMNVPLCIYVLCCVRVRACVMNSLSLSGFLGRWVNEFLSPNNNKKKAPQTNYLYPNLFIGLQA